VIATQGRRVAIALWRRVLTVERRFAQIAERGVVGSRSVNGVAITTRRILV
jgi:hypothetical protein